MRIRGVIEGFYGPPWSHAERLDLLRFTAAEGFNLWVHAPKDDPYHRRLWREPYPDDELACIAELAAEASRLGLDFAYAIAPGLDLAYSEEREWEALAAKIEQLRGAGVRSFQLLWDDIERRDGAAHGDFTNRFREAFPQPGPLVVCPTGYAGTEETPYRRGFGAELHPEILVYWTGPEVVSGSITRADAEAATAAFGHELLLWDNYPVNDFAPGKLNLGPLRGRESDLPVAGLVANAMVQAVPSKLPLATVADWLRDPQGYDPDASFERALRDYGDEVEDAVRRLGPEVDVAGALAQLGRA